MRLIQHTADLIVANLNHLLDRLEQPEVMLKHRLAKSEDQIRALSVLVARSIAAEQLLTKQVAEHQRRSELYLSQARRALVAGDEAAARRALSQRLEHDRAAGELADSLSQATRHNEQLRTNLRQLQTRHALARQRFAAWTAKAQVYSLSAGNRAPAATAALGRALEQCDVLWEQLERADCETEALIDLEPMDSPRWTHDPQLDKELERLRQGM